MNILGIIPAKSNSEGIKNKNFITIGKKKLIDFSLIELKKSKLISHKFVDTDSVKIANHATKYNIKIPFLREKKYAKKNSSISLTILNSLKKLEKFYSIKFDMIVLLQPTSPLRNLNDIHNSIKIFLNSKSDTLLSLSLIDEPHPFKIRKIKKNYAVSIINHKRKNMNRQGLPKYYKPNGAIYIVKRNYFLKNKSFTSSRSAFYIMPKERSINLDTNEDLLILKNELKKKD